MDIKLKRAPGIYLTGFMGSGKTTVARMLADRLELALAFRRPSDAEDRSLREHLTIAQIFESSGEAGFRRIESEVIEQIARTIERGMPFVVALGGGAFVAAQPRFSAGDSRQFGVARLPTRNHRRTHCGGCRGTPAGARSRGPAPVVRRTHQRLPKSPLHGERGLRPRACGRQNS